MNKKLGQRTYMTYDALKVLQDLVRHFNIIGFHNDIGTLDSDQFYARITIRTDSLYGSSGYREWVNTKSFWRIQQGILRIMSVDTITNEEESYRPVSLLLYQQVNFLKCMTTLEALLAKYKQELNAKDDQIATFMKLCGQMQAANQPEGGKPTC